ncbi:hypothetical protein BsWGS_04289 [Bradybaena similaris]
MCCVVSLPVYIFTFQSDTSDFSKQVVSYMLLSRMIKLLQALSYMLLSEMIQLLFPSNLLRLETEPRTVLVNGDYELRSFLIGQGHSLFLTPIFEEHSVAVPLYMKEKIITDAVIESK